MGILDSDNVRLSKTYKEHVCFKELDEAKKFYECVSDRAFCFLPSGTKGFANYETYVFMSIYGTLDSIKELLLKGRINDAYVLVRKFYDDILAEIYLTVFLKDKFDIKKGLYVDEVQQWIESSYRIPSIKIILQTLKTSTYTKDLYPFFGWKTYLEHNRHVLDDCVHANRYSSMLFNCNTIYLNDNREKQLDGIVIILKQLMRIQVAFIFYLNPLYFMASDYMDYIEFGEQPPQGADYWIATYAQEAFDKYIKPDAKLAAFIKESCCLEIE